MPEMRDTSGVGFAKYGIKLSRKKPDLDLMLPTDDDQLTLF